MKGRGQLGLEVVAIAALLSPGLAFAESMRCGKWVVNETASPTELLQKCGEPQDKQVTQEDVLGKNTLGNPIKLGVQVTERWLYKRSEGALPMRVIIVDGKITRIERAQ